jgi:hypothetical protein
MKIGKLSFVDLAGSDNYEVRENDKADKILKKGLN